MTPNNFYKWYKYEVLQISPSYKTLKKKEKSTGKHMLPREKAPKTPENKYIGTKTYVYSIHRVHQ